MPVDKPPILLKSRSENHHIASINGSVNSGINMVSSDGSGTAPVYSIQRPQPAGGHRLAPGSDNIRHHVAGEGTWYYYLSLWLAVDMTIFMFTAVNCLVQLY